VPRRGPVLKAQCLEHQHSVVAVAATSARASGAGTSPGTGSPRTRTDSSAGVTGTGVVVVPVGRLLKIQDVDCRDIHELLDNDRANDQDEEEHKHRKVEDGVADDTALAKLRLLERVDWRTNLTTAIC